ncbi:2-succinyl-6-hydroxy-2,4-cyclohexadiene-1-carboxylate synthase [Halobacillus salinus]|uniref:Putative 2-succinyl-6-hydroxy-2,4-cyclohexadiene-1-carboxylate synthase n=1 Tax=Halobacillus salinus TaxID=192814 RepID=A0A4Z0GZ63_9BACI|nr:2-succinyl-6-hydroxy-2,4-cyclohexadiene-1-carboxylate synthase [Halobacillus salinus]TGB02501.1 2-succinyl-6-hydroxy-2,4-cyclohexadiene-1-carboxylate synthase [Halobacillus salinus]
MYRHVEGRNYWVEEQGEGQPLLLLHGFTGTLHTFDEVVEGLEGYRLIRVDLPGHGKTGVIGNVTMEEFCRDLSLLLEDRGLDSVALLGYSLGGRTALSFAQLYPEKVDRLLLESASPGLATSKEQLARQAKDKALVDKMVQEGIEAFVNYWETLPLFESQQALSEEKRSMIRKERLGQSPSGLSQSLMGMGTGVQPSWWDQLPTLDVPVLLVTGELDDKFRQINQHMHKELLNSEWIEVEQTGHAIHVEKPSIFAKIVDEFMIQ